jgi:Protein of unknown function (DUF2505)
VRFHVVQPIAAPREAVLRAVADPALYEAMGSIPNIGPPQVLESSTEGPVTHLRIRYRFVGNLSRAARAVLDPEKLTWVIALEVDTDEGRANFTMLPDHYPDRLECSGTYDFEDKGETTEQVMDGEMRVHAPLVAGLVERAIVSGLRDHLVEQATVIERFVKGGS